MEESGFESPGTVHLDTVRALHQTVVSLRTALELSKNELKELKNKYEKHSQCIEFSDVIEKLTLENHILRRKIIDSGQLDSPNEPDIQLEVIYSPRRSDRVTDISDSEIIIKTATDIVDSDVLDHTSEENHSHEVLYSTEEGFESPRIDVEPNYSPDVNKVNEDGPLAEKPEKYSQTSFKTKLELLSKFDVRIKVCTLKDGIIDSSTTSETESTTDKVIDKKEIIIKDQRKAFKVIDTEEVQFKGHRDSNKVIDNDEDKFEDHKQSFKVLDTDEVTLKEYGDNKSVDTEELKFEKHTEYFKNTNDFNSNLAIKTFTSEDIKMAVPLDSEAKKSDKFDVQVKITSEENLVINEVGERKRKNDTMNLDVDDLSLRSLSEGDNSVFSESVYTPANQSRMESTMHEKRFEDVGSDNESEEVDDIELIFTTDESKDMSNLQEDLVPLKESDWGPSPTSTSHSTPVLIKFNTLDPDYQPETDNVDPDTVKTKRVSLPNANDREGKLTKVGFNSKSMDLARPGILKMDKSSKDNLFKSGSRRLDSVDSLTCDYRGLSFDNTKSSSFELGSSMDILNRDESMDNFHKNAHLGHRFSVFAESDMSKCGISEDDLASANLNIRRNTCPNPFQYRPLPQRGYSRVPGPFKATVTPSMSRRPILREDNYSIRKENGAQTEVSALPNRWSSDGYLAHKVGVNPELVLPTLPRPAAPVSRRLTVAESRPTLSVPRANDTRRILLSDIGFTSMVPELSRSADPVWSRGTCGCPCNMDSQNAAKFLSRGSYRSPCPSVDRSNDWTYGTALFKEHRAWRSSLPDVRRDDTDELVDEAEVYLRRSIDNLRSTVIETDAETRNLSGPYLPAEPRHLRLGHAVKIITPQGRIAVGKVRYVGLAGSNATDSCIMVGAIFPLSVYPWIPLNDGTHRARRYFHAPPHHTALFVPFTKVVMAWAN